MIVRKSKAFTLIELVTIILLIGIIVAIVEPRFFNSSPYHARLYHEELYSTLRDARTMAMNSGCFVKLNYNSSDKKYSFERNEDATCDNSSYVDMLGTTGRVSEVESDANFSVSNNQSFPLYFSAKGQLVDSDVIASMSTVDLTITITGNESIINRNIYINGDTGFINES